MNLMLTRWQPTLDCHCLHASSATRLWTTGRPRHGRRPLITPVVTASPQQTNTELRQAKSAGVEIMSKRKEYRTRAGASGAVALGTFAAGAFAFGAVAIGAFAIGALAI